jgi:hypothetical protein
MFVPAQYVSIIRGANKKTDYRISLMKWSTRIFFYLKALSGSLESNFSKTTENETVKMTDIKIVKVDKRSPSKRPTLRKITKKL